MASSSSTSLEPLQVYDENEPENVSSLPSADRGKDAWLFLASSFMMEALIWGFALSFGIMQEYYSTHPPFENSSNIASVGTTASGIMYLTAPIWFGTIALWPSVRKWMIWSGPFIIAAALIGSSFATTVGQLIATQGVLYAIGGSSIYIPTMSLLNEWFVQRKGLAFGIMLGGTGTAGVAVPLIMNAALEKYGHQIVLRGLAVITLFLVLELANVLQGLGYFIPGIYLPSYASNLGAGQITSALTLVVVNVTSIVGSILVGGMSDRLHVTTVMGAAALATSAGVFIFWGLSSNLGLLFAFCAVYGLSAGGFSSSWPAMVGALQRKLGHVDIGLALGFLGAGRGIGNVISGPVSEKIMRIGASGTGYEGEYGPLIIFTGVTAICSGFAVLTLGKTPGSTSCRANDEALQLRGKYTMRKDW